MVTSELYYKYNPWWETRFELTGVFPRSQLLNRLMISFGNKQIVILTGLRRVGKTTLMKIIIHQLITSGFDPNKIFYISLDDYLLRDKNIIEIIIEYRKIVKLPLSEKIYLFLNEVAYKKDFENQLKNIFDSENAKVFVSSSSSSILRSQKTFLTGRNFLIEIMPLDFDEYLQFKNINLGKADDFLKGRYFEDFLKTGGIPEYVIRGEIEYLKELIDDIVNRDIVAYHKVKDVTLVRDLFFLLMERAGKNVSINKLAKIVSISPDTARRYLKMFEDSYLVYLIPRWGKPNVRIVSPKKLYAADLGIRTYYTGFKDIGSLFENYIYFKIRNQNPHYVSEKGQELDFLTEDKKLIEVKYNRNLEGKQKQFFESFKAKEKILIGSFSDIRKLN